MCDEGADTTVVLDLNGVLADVRKKDSPAVMHRQPDVVLLNGQKVYVHPHAEEFLSWVSNIMGVRVVTYTSRLERNAVPVEQFIGSRMSAAGYTAFVPDVRLYQADCSMVTQHNGETRPLKLMSTVRDKGQSHGRVIFVDDHPERIVMRPGEAMIVNTRTFNAAEEAATLDNLEQAASAISAILNIN